MGAGRASRQQAEGRDHPRAHLLSIVVPQAFHHGARVCGQYENDTYHRLSPRSFSRGGVVNTQMLVTATIEPLVAVASER